MQTVDHILRREARYWSRRCPQIGSPEDLYQEGYIVASKVLKKYGYNEGGGAFRALLTASLRNQYRGFIRKVNRDRDLKLAFRTGGTRGRETVGGRWLRLWRNA